MRSPGKGWALCSSGVSLLRSGLGPGALGAAQGAGRDLPTVTWPLARALFLFDLHLARVGVFFFLSFSFWSFFFERLTLLIYFCLNGKQKGLFCQVLGQTSPAMAGALGQRFPASPCSRGVPMVLCPPREIPEPCLSSHGQVRKWKCALIFIFALKFGPRGAANVLADPGPFRASVSPFAKWGLVRWVVVFQRFHWVMLRRANAASLLVRLFFLFTMFLASKLSLGLHGWVHPAPKPHPVSGPSAALAANGLR